MTALRKSLHLTLAIVLSFGFYYIAGWFISNEPNLFIWSTLGKVVYLILSGLMVIRLLETFGWEYNEEKN
jgi:hypothetical protein